MTSVFVLLAVLLALGTVWLLLRPLLREDAEAPARPAHTRTAIGLVMLLLGATPVLYFAVGTPQALDPANLRAPAAAASGEAPDMETALAQLEARLQEQPNDVTGWMLLGRSYRALQRFAESRDAIARAFALAPEEPDVIVEQVEAQTLASSDRRFSDENLALLRKALQLNPAHERGLLLLGVSHAQREEHAEAAEAWERLAAVLPPGSEALVPLRERIEASRAAAGLPPSAPPSPDSAVPDTGSGLAVRIELDPALQDRIDAQAALFVVARDPAGGPPVAARRLPATGFPLTLSLQDSDRMLPGAAIASLPALRLSARISQAGNATPAPGDLESEAVDLVPAEAGETVLRIGRVR